MGNGVFGIAVGGLNAAQANLLVTQHNITNANTPGYHRQQAVLSSNTAQLTGGGYLGQGVHVDTVKRMYNDFLESQVLTSSAQKGYYDTYLMEINQLANMLGDTNSGLAPAVEELFKGVQEVATNAASQPARQSLLSSGEALISRFKILSQRMSELGAGVNSQIQSSVSLINSYAAQIAELNDKIALATGSGASQPPNDLLDQRDAAIAGLNKEVRTTTLKQDDGTYNIFIGTGQTLVIGNRSFNLTAEQSKEDPDAVIVGYTSGSNIIALKSSSLDGGNLGGLLAFRTESLEPAQNALGRVAVGLYKTFNDQHVLGQDLNGDLGGNFFNLASTSPAIVAHKNNTGTAALTATLVDEAELTTSNYRLTYDAGTTTYTLTNLGDNTTTSFGTFPRTVDGVTFNLSAGAPADEDSWLILPTRYAARDISMAVTDTSKIAAAAPMRTAVALTNAGTGKISAGTVNSFNNEVTITFTGAATYSVTDNTTGAVLATGLGFAAPETVSFNGWTVTLTGAPAVGDMFVIDKKITSAGSGNTGTGVIGAATIAPPDPDLRDTVQIVFDTPPTTFHVVGATTGAPTVARTYTSGQPISFNGWTVNITGVPVAGDTFTVSQNTNGVSDNRNAVLLGALQTKNTLVNSSNGAATATFQGAYGQLVSQVGNTARRVEVIGQSQTNLVKQAEELQQSLSGVNLDEEAANLIRYQQAYQASGKMIQIANTLFDTLFEIGR